MALTFEERLNQILPKIVSDDFLSSKGPGNEIGFWIFDYPPEREMEMRDFLTRLDAEEILGTHLASQPAPPRIDQAGVPLLTMAILIYRPCTPCGS